MVELDLGFDIETRIVEAAKVEGVTVDSFVRDRLAAQLPAIVSSATLEARRKAAVELSTFAQDRSISLPAGVSIRDVIEGARRY